MKLTDALFFTAADVQQSATRDPKEQTCPRCQDLHTRRVQPAHCYDVQECCKLCGDFVRECRR